MRNSMMVPMDVASQAILQEYRLLAGPPTTHLREADAVVCDEVMLHSAETVAASIVVVVAELLGEAVESSVLV